MSEKKDNSSGYERAEYIHTQVLDPITEVDADGKPLYTTYKVVTETTFPEYSSNSFFVRRRYR